ncbi:MAG TPA: hypothetical protein VFF78_01970 [Anaerolineaceae bacterium]|nr:hypothetical protein [Anaerolineaceae bacterium]
MKRVLFAFMVLAMALSACTPQPSELAKQAQVSALALDSLHGSAPECNSMDENAMCHDFDINQYFKSLPRLAMREGYVLDYIIHQDGMGSYPVLYVRGVDQTPYTSEAAFTQAQSEGKLLPGDVLEYVEVEDSATGYLDYAVFLLLRGQFYLGWHANYFDTTVVATPEQLESLLAATGFGMEIPKEIADEARKLDLTPVVTMGEKEVTVSLVLFTKWGGFYRQTFKFNRTSPHTILDSQQETLVEYECGIMF